MTREAANGRIRNAKSNAANVLPVARSSFSERHATTTSADSSQQNKTKKVSETAIPRRADISVAPGIYYHGPRFHALWFPDVGVRGVCVRPGVATHRAVA